MHIYDLHGILSQHASLGFLPWCREFKPKHTSLSVYFSFLEPTLAQTTLFQYFPYQTSNLDPFFFFLNHLALVFLTVRDDLPGIHCSSLHKSTKPAKTYRKSKSHQRRSMQKPAARDKIFLEDRPDRYLYRSSSPLSAQTRSAQLCSRWIPCEPKGVTKGKNWPKAFHSFLTEAMFNKTTVIKTSDILKLK